MIDYTSDELDRLTEDELMECPQHGEQRVTAYSVGNTKGADPYNVDKLACGHYVIALSSDPADTYIVNSRQVQR